MFFLVPAYPGSPGQRVVKQVCVCACVCVRACVCACACVRVLRTGEESAHDASESSSKWHGAECS